MKSEPQPAQSDGRIEFPVTRSWARRLVPGQPLVVLMSVAEGVAVPVVLLRVPSDGLVTVKLPNGFEAHVPIAILRRHCTAVDGTTPPEMRAAP